MKKLAWMTAVALVFASGSLVAQERTDSTGCGLGTMVWEGKSGTAEQILAVTTNGTSSNQTFGITSGTLGCTQDGTIKPPKKAEFFTDANLDKLAQDMSRGQGETLTSLAEVIGIEAEDRSVFYAAAQNNFGRIFTSNDATARQVLESLYAVMAEDAKLSRYVSA